MDTTYNIPTDILQTINSQQAYTYRIVPVKDTSSALYLKTDQDSDGLQSELEIILGRPIILERETSDILNKYLAVNYRQISSVSEHFEYSEDFLEKIILLASDIGSSDIHLEAYEDKHRLRFRIDGKLKEFFIIDQDEYLTMVNKLKIQSGLDISEKRLPQDGRIHIDYSEHSFDIRISTMPTLFGEKVVLRLLKKDARQIDIHALGFEGDQLETYLSAVRKPNGIILISGPTGSGKTTTLYATLKHLNDDNTNILTIEDPIEYTLSGINQVQLKEDIGLDFVSTLKSFLRQDPDIIMVGEIRDDATANMAIRSALTGHLVLSTIHTNSAWATISRLIDMNVPAFLIASTLNISLAQRLVRLLCNHCKEKTTIVLENIPKEIHQHLDFNTHYIQKGCAKCHYTGYKGRKAIYEVIPISTQLVESIKNKEFHIDGYLKHNHIDTLKDKAIKLIKSGESSIEEVYALLIN